METLPGCTLRRWIAYIGQPIFLEELIVKPSRSLIDQSIAARYAKVPINGDGFGVGWYAERAEPGLYRDVLPAWGEPNLCSLAQQVRSGLFFAHVRASTGAPSARANCHPFASGRWMFMHNGQSADYGLVQRRLDTMISDRHYTLKQGSTDSESLFLSFLSRNGNAPHTAVADVLREVMALQTEYGDHGCLRFTAALTNGREIWAYRYASDRHAPSLFYQKLPTGIVLVSEPLCNNPDHWTELPTSSRVHADVAGELTIGHWDCSDIKFADRAGVS